MAHPLFSALRHLKGNARGCVYTEPLWGIPFNLYAPYVSVYMLSLGLTDARIGLIISISLVFQFIFSLLSGAITDKLGRKRTTFIFDFISWSIPSLIYAVAQNFTFFLAAALVNSMWRITMNSWSCLLVEDTDPKQLIDIYTWIYISNFLVGFVSPVAGLLIEHFSLVPTMRALYIFAFIMFTLKFVATNSMVTETRQGRVRMEETKNQSLFFLLGEYKHVFKQILHAPQTLYTIGIMLALSACQTINSTFWSILVTKKLMIPAQDLAIYPFFRSAIMLIFYFFVMPRIKEMNFRNPMLIGAAGFIFGQVLLITIPGKNYWLLGVSTLLDAVSLSTISILIDRMVAITVDAKERARILAIIYVMVISFTSPFGWIAGLLSSVNRNLPFMLNMILVATGAVLVFLAARHADQQAAVSPATDAS
jgi:DHA1 family tetracycline resistance protein-like MFS transporter